MGKFLKIPAIAGKVFLYHSDQRFFSGLGQSLVLKIPFQNFTHFTLWFHTSGKPVLLKKSERAFQLALVRPPFHPTDFWMLLNHIYQSRRVILEYAQSMDFSRRVPSNSKTSIQTCVPWFSHRIVRNRKPIMCSSMECREYSLNQSHKIRTINQWGNKLPSSKF